MACGEDDVCLDVSCEMKCVVRVVILLIGGLDDLGLPEMILEHVSFMGLAHSIE